jgi:hypothetical protein
MGGFRQGITRRVDALEAELENASDETEEAQS